MQKEVRLFQRKFYRCTLCQRAAAMKYEAAVHKYDAMRNTYKFSWYGTVS